MADRASRNSASAEGSAGGSDGYPGFPPRPAADATGALLLPAALDLRDLEDVTDAELTTILRRCSAAFLTRLARLCVRIVRAEPEVIYCQEPCSNPDCNQACGRRIDPTRRRGPLCRLSLDSLDFCRMTSAPPAFDDPLALSALLAKWTAPDSLHPLLVAKGFRTIASIAYAIPGDGSPDDFLRVLWPPSDPDNPPTLVTFEASFARRLLVQSRALVHPPASSAGPAAAAIPSTPPPKITAENAETLRTKFIDSYPGELLSPASTPSVEFLNRLRAELDKPTTLWVPWRLRTSEHDLQMFYENRRPRSDGQLLRHLLDGVPEPVTAQAPAHTSGPVEPALRRHLGLLITALAFLGDLHLKLGKAYAESFISAATATPLDSSLRPPSMQEVLAADKAVWGAIAGLMRDEKFSLADALQEITVTRHMIPTVLCPRPRSMPAPPVRDSNPRGGANVASDRISDQLHAFTRELLSLVLINGGIAILENPSTSLLWHHPGCMSWIRHHCLSAVEVSACNHGLDVFKSWTFVSNLSDLSALASSCQHPRGSHAAISGLRDSSGQFLTRHTACYPASLCSRLASILAPLLSQNVGVVPFLDWEKRLLAPKLHWPIPASRVEDGAGSCSTGSWSVPQGEDSFKQLRQAWMQRITRPDFLGKFRANLASGSKDPPLSDVDLRPFLEDLRSFLRLSEKEFETLLCVPPGQPFRLFLLEALLEVSRDPDISFIDLLVEGVPLGVDEAMPSCPALFPPSAPVSPKVPLQHCESAWGSALSDPQTVDSLLDSEIREGWVQPVPGGLAALKANYSRSAVGKLGLVKAPDRDPRLVVDSSVSGVTDHTSLPNKSANPTISGLRRCAPARPALEALFALILNVS
ncbi:LRRC45 [Symbiodinium sp. CCMP2456]|nr:LRRC45 [Symbiodinium sp. CCMP2456]